MGLKSLKFSMVFIMALSLAALPAGVFAACASPSKVQICVAVDDYAEVWINGTDIGQFNYVNWDQNGVYPTCVTISPSLINETGNIVALDIGNLRCCEIWGSWAIDTTCADGTDHSYISSNDPGNWLYKIPNACVTTPVPPNDTNGATWWSSTYIGVATPTWVPPVSDTGMIWGKQIYDPRTGQLLRPISYNSGGNAATGDCQHLFMRQAFDMVTQTPPPPPSFTITKSVVGKSTQLNTNDKVTYVLNICNNGVAEPGFVSINDTFDPGFGFSGFEGPNGGCNNGYNFGPNYCPNSGYFQVQYPKGFPGFTCVNVTVYVQDYWVDSSEYCKVRNNVANFVGPVETATSNTVSVSMYCPGTPTLSLTFTPTNTITPTFTFSPTFTVTNTITFSPTKTKIPTWTNSPTSVPTNSTFTQTPTISVTWTLSQTMTSTVTPTPTITMTWALAIGMAKSEDKTQVPLGDTVMYCISFTNLGATTADFDIWDTIPGPMDFLYCIGGCTGPVTYGSTTDCPDSPGGHCRVINWHISGMQPGDWGTVCFYVQAARLAFNEPKEGKSFFADVNDKFLAMLKRNYLTPDRYYRSIRGPD
jgi:uncharacterized repeat protein (TIGR01451 family)